MYMCVCMRACVCVYVFVHRRRRSRRGRGDQDTTDEFVGLVLICSCQAASSLTSTLNPKLQPPRKREREGHWEEAKRDLVEGNSDLVLPHTSESKET
jgi:hypothetical protein